jgi:cysteine desulfurase
MIGIAAFGKACEVAGDDMAEQAAFMEMLRTRLLDGLLDRVADVRLNGDAVRRLPNTLNMSFEYVEAESLLIGLDLAGIAVSSGSACSSGSVGPSHVLLAMGIDPVTCQSAIRMSLGRDNTEEDVEYALQVIPEVVQRLRAMSPLSGKR